MFDDVRARYALRAVLFGLSAFASAMVSATDGSVLTWTEVVHNLFLGVSIGLGYAGLGAISPQIEPNIGIKKEG